MKTYNRALPGCGKIAKKFSEDLKGFAEPYFTTLSGRCFVAENKSNP